ncbi:hypothetical protein KDH_55660 [Dictyobacter sp. S3.2.2.5]|uniref:RING-type domain-containing protein n=1 Tax=Dictyobacter halimunensis TaxID=3026934 RepID=A0ABQ6FY33_9CHLR|nr:hypothetical protein KDH_55660 [Dictyobacter sp. S3.2.2.5]
MDCLCLVAPKDEDLLRYVLDGEVLSPPAMEHLADCSVCQQRLNRYITANDVLLTHLYRCQCPSMTVLSYYCIGMLSAHEQDKISTHLKVCPLCADNVAETYRFLHTPLPLADSLSSLPARPENTIKPAGWRFPVTLKKPVTHVRVWPHFHQTDTVTLSLQAQPGSHNKIMLTGLLSARNSGENGSLFSGTRVELYKAVPPVGIEESMGEHAVYTEQLSTYPDQPLFSTRVDDRGSMLFGAVPCGEYLMIVYLPETALVIEKLHIEASFPS